MATKRTSQQPPALFKVEPKPLPTKKDWQDSSKELRIRNFSVKHKEKLKEIMKVTKKPFESYAVEFLIENYLQDQNLIKQLQQRNSQLHATVNKLVNRENDVAAFIKSVQEFLTEETKTIGNLLNLSIKKSQRLGKEFKKVGTVKRKASVPGRTSGRPTVPKKKGGKK